MNNDKLVLEDGTEIVLESSQGIGTLCVLSQSKRAACDLWERFTKENLKKVTVKNSAGMTVGIYPDMVLDHVVGRENPDGTVQVTFSLRSKSTAELLEERISAVEEGQKAQDAGIDDLGQAISDMMEGGMQ